MGTSAACEKRKKLHYDEPEAEAEAEIIDKMQMHPKVFYQKHINSKSRVKPR